MVKVPSSSLKRPKSKVLKNKILYYFVKKLTINSVQTKKEKKVSSSSLSLLIVACAEQSTLRLDVSAGHQLPRTPTPRSSSSVIKSETSWRETTPTTLPWL